MAGPSAIPPAPARTATPLPGSFTLTMDPSTVAFDGGSVLMSGTPLRLQRLSSRAQTLVDRWCAGAPVGDRAGARLLARRLASAGALIPRPHGAAFTADDVTVVIPVRDRPAELQRLLASLKGLACVVVDDASADAALTREIADEHRARFVGLPVNTGPAAARNAGLADVTTSLVAFVDSDCLPATGWLDPLLGYLDDPLVAAVAPRIIPLAPERSGWISRYEAVRSSLDRGERDGLVRPGSRLPYVPGAALLLRRAVAGEHLFDPRLRSGEDVDLVWRLVEAGWDVRYVPASRVEHEGPQTLRSFLGRRAFYGLSAAPLSKRHPDDMAPLNASAWSAAVWALAAWRRPLLATGVLTASILLLARRLTGLVRQPVKVAGQIAGGGTARAALPALSGVTRAWSPALVAGLLSRRTRGAAALALLAPAVRDWAGEPGDLDPVRYACLHVADDLAYGSGVWAGCLQQRTVRPLVPRLAWRSRVWSSPSLRSHLGPRHGAMAATD